MAKRIRLGFHEQSSYFSSWTDEVYCTKRKDGTFSLRARKTGEHGKHWFPGTTRIKTPRQFIEAYRSIDEIDIDQIDLESDALPELSKLDPVFATDIRKEIESDELDEEARYERRVALQPVMKNAKITYPSGNMNARLYFEEVWRYVIAFTDENGAPPTGSHRIGGREVIFNDASTESV